VSATCSITSACRQTRRRAPARGGAGAASIAVIPLLTPGISVDVIAERLPEARLVLLHEPQPADPLRRLPEIEVRDQEARWAAVLRRQGLAVEPGRHQAFATEQVLERQVGRIPAVAVRHEVRGRRLLEARRREQVVDRDSLPDGPELAPLGHAVDVDRELGLRQRLEVLPGPLANERPTVLQAQVPPVERRMWCWPGAQDREVLGHVLAGRDPLPVRFGPLAPGEASGRDHGRLLGVAPACVTTLQNVDGPLLVEDRAQGLSIRVRAPAEYRAGRVRTRTRLPPEGIRGLLPGGRRTGHI